MTFLCFEFASGNNISVTEVIDSGTCPGWVAVDSITYNDNLIQGLTYAESGQLIGATALLFSIAFIFRSVRKHLGF